MKKSLLILAGIFLELFCLIFVIYERKISNYLMSNLKWDVWHIGILFYLCVFAGAICIGLGFTNNSGTINRTPSRREG